MTRYRKRGTEVDAFRWTGRPVQAEDPMWVDDMITLGRIRFQNAGTLNVKLYIDLPSGKGTPLVANVGDWVVRNARGDVFPMTPEKFAETYEAIDDVPRAVVLALRDEWDAKARPSDRHIAAYIDAYVDAYDDLLDGRSHIRSVSTSDTASCSFCGKPPREVKHLVAAATGARICDECLAGARELEPK